MNAPSTSKIGAGIAAAVSGVSAFVAWLATVPPSEQNALLGPIVDLLPIDWRPAIGLFMRALSTFSTIYAVYQAAKSGPATQPKNPTNE